MYIYIFSKNGWGKKPYLSIHLTQIDWWSKSIFHIQIKYMNNEWTLINFSVLSFSCLVSSGKWNLLHRSPCEWTVDIESVPFQVLTTYYMTSNSIVPTYYYSLFPHHHVSKQFQMSSPSISALIINPKKKIDRWIWWVLDINNNN